jgi:hypothetical protein
VPGGGPSSVHDDAVGSSRFATGTVSRFVSTVSGLTSFFDCFLFELLETEVVLTDAGAFGVLCNGADDERDR